MSNHLGTARRGAVMLASAQVAKVGLHFASLVILSRLLGPSHLGHLALLTSLVALGELMRDGGLTTAAIQSARLTRGQATNLFWLSSGLGALLAVATVGFAQWVPGFIGVSALGSTLPWVGVSFLLMGIQAQFQVQLVRDAHIGRLSFTDVMGQASGLVCATALAVSGAVHASLVCIVVIPPAVVLLSRVLATSWRPGVPRRGQGTAKFFRFGSTLALAQGLTFASSNVDRFIIAARFPLQELGVYSRAMQLMNLPVSQFMTPLVNVVLPILADLRESPAHYWKFLRSFHSSVAAVLLCGLALAVPTSERVIQLVLGDGWGGAAFVFQILAIGGCFQVLSQANFWVFLSLDSARHLLKYSLLTKPLTILAVVIGGLFSLEGVALGYSLCLVASWFIGLAWLRGVTDMPTAEIFKDGIALLTAALVAGTTTGILGGLVSGTNLALLWAVGAGAFMGMLLVLPRTRTSVRQSGGYLAAVLRHRGRGTEGSRHDHVVGQHQEES